MSGGVFQIGPGGLSVGTPSGFLKPAVLVLGSLIAAACLWSRSGGVRTFGFAGYSMALASGFAFGMLRAIITLRGGLEGEPAGPQWLAVTIGVLALVSALGLLPLVALFVEDFRGRV